MEGELEVIVICGPTSTGKTSLAIKLCKELNGEIVSADSRQIYKHMDVGTGKLPINQKEVNVVMSNGLWIINGVKIWGYDLVTPDHNYSAYEFRKYALNKIDEIEGLGKKAFLVGGTGFYIDAVTGRIKLSGVKPDPKRRKALNKTPTQSLVRRLRELDPQRAKNIDLQNRYRLIRALEIAFEKESKLLAAPYEKPFYTCEVEIGLQGNKHELYQKADKWVDKVWNSLVGEVRDLIAEGYEKAPLLQGLVYRTVLQYLDNKINEKEAVQQIKFDLHGYIRRQLTWFRRNTDIKWINISQPGMYEKVLDLLKSS